MPLASLDCFFHNSERAGSHAWLYNPNVRKIQRCSDLYAAYYGSPLELQWAK